MTKDKVFFYFFNASLNAISSVKLGNIQIGDNIPWIKRVLKKQNNIVS